MSEKEHPSSDSEEEETFEESVLEAISLTGVLETRRDAEKKSKYYWYLLTGGSLHEYRTVKHHEPKESFNLKGCEVVRLDKTSTIFELRKNGKTILVFLPQTEETVNEWMTALSAAVNLEPRPAPKRLKGNKGTIRMRMKKTLAGKMAISTPGKFMAKSSVPEEVQRLINSLNLIMKVEIGETEAEEVEDNIIKTYVKCFCLEEAGQVKIEDFMRIDQPMRKAFLAITHLRDSAVAGKLSKEDVDESIKKIKDGMREMEQLLVNLVTPHLKPHSIQRIQVIFAHIANPAFLRRAILPSKMEGSDLEDEIDNLCMAMDKYLSVPYYQDE